MSTTVAKGSVVLSTDTEALLAGLKKATADIQGFQTKVGNISFFGSGGIGAAVAGMRIGFDQIKGWMTEIQRMGDESEKTLAMADSFGLMAEEAQTLSFAAKQAGVDQENFNKILRKTSELTFDAASGSEEMAKKLDKLGITNADFSKLGTADALKALLDKVGEGGGNRVGAFSDLFGGKLALDAIKLMGAELDKAGQKYRHLALTADELRTLDDAADKISEISASMDVAGKKSTAWLINSMGPMLEASLKNFSGPPTADANQDEIAKMMATSRGIHGQDFTNKDGTKADALARQIKEAQKVADALKLVQAESSKVNDEYDIALKSLGKMAHEVDQIKFMSTTKLQGNDLMSALSKMDDTAALKAAGGLMKDDPMARFKLQMQGLEKAKALGIGGADAGISAAFQQLKGAAGLGYMPTSMELPSLIQPGSIEEIRDSMRSRLDDIESRTDLDRKGTSMEQIKEALEKSKDIDSKNSVSVIEGLKDVKKAIEQLPNNLSGI